nr:MAG TPA: hypothetical protein [Caudoviricetes sp.]
MVKVVNMRQPQGRLADALSDAGIWWLEAGSCPVRIYPGSNIGGYWELDFSWQDRNIGVALAVHFKEPKRASSYWENAEASNRALLNIAATRGWRIIQPDPSQERWIPDTVARVAEALKGTPWATGGVAGGTRG